MSDPVILNCSADLAAKRGAREPATDVLFAMAARGVKGFPGYVTCRTEKGIRFWRIVDGADIR